MVEATRPKTGYVICAIVSIVLAILAIALPTGIVRTVCWVALLPSVIAFPHMTERFGVHMGGRRLVVAYAVLYGLFWLLLDAGVLGAQAPFDQLYAAWVIAFLAVVCVQYLTQRGKKHNS
jgi:hypothetical protein